jgi:hypothetical protein
MSFGCISKGEELPWRFLQLAGIDTASRDDVMETQGKENIGVVSFLVFLLFQFPLSYMFSHVHKQYALQFPPKKCRHFAGCEVANNEQYLTPELDKSSCLMSVNDSKWGRKDMPPGHYHGYLNTNDRKWGKVDAPGHCHIMDQPVEDIVMVRLLNMH